MYSSMAHCVDNDSYDNLCKGYIENICILLSPSVLYERRLSLKKEYIRQQSGDVVTGKCLFSLLVISQCREIFSGIKLSIDQTEN